MIAMLDPLVQRIRGEFLEMPGLSLTERQAARLWNLDVHTTRAALRTLVDEGFLALTNDSRFVAARWATREASGPAISH